MNDEEFMMFLGLRIKRERELRRISQSALGRAVDMRQSKISRFESGEELISISQLVKIVYALGIRWDEVLPDPELYPGQIVEQFVWG